MSVKIKAKTVVGLFVHVDHANGASEFTANNDITLVDSLNTAIMAGDGIVIVSPSNTQCVWVSENPKDVSESNINFRLTMMTGNIVYGHGLLLGFDPENMTVCSLQDESFNRLIGH